MLLENCTQMRKFMGAIFILDKVQMFGLQSVYSSDDHFAHNIKLLTALAYVPPESVVEAY